MNKSGFYISKLVLQDASKTEASIDFAPGCNVVSGASDTGKTFILQCIDYLLGAGTPPKTISEAYGYRYLFLELKVHSGATYTLMRDLNEPEKTYMTDGIVDDFWDLHEKSNVEVLTSKKSKNATSVSDILLRISGFKGTELIRKDSENKKKGLSFRDVVHLTVIDEKEIITEKSPVFNESVTDETAKAAVFQLLISGEDSSELLEVADPKTTKQKLNAQLQLIDDMSKELAHKISLHIKEAETAGNISAEEEIAKINEQYVEIEKALASKREERQVVSGNLDLLRQEIASLNELISRFVLLKSQYQSDLDRLEFLGEGEHLYSQLNNASCECPLCGSVINMKENIGNESRSAIQAEVKKITHNLRELVVTLDANIEQKRQLVERENAEAQKYRSCEDEITRKLQPFKSSIQVELQKLVARQKKMLDINTFRRQLADFAEKRKWVEAELGQVKKVKGSTGLIDKKSLGGFVESVKSLLTQWSFLSGNEEIDFDTKTRVFDFSIDGVYRSSHGKGVRALLYSAFILGLMNHCHKNNLPHPLVVLLDTPLNSFKEKDPKFSDEEKISRIKSSFFETLSTWSKDMQIIIFENIVPPTDVQGEIKYHYFSGQVGVGRAAFIPPEKTEEK